MNKPELIEQTKNAFDFIQKLYLEVSYLIKEVEGLLAEEDEHFVIGRPGGYGISTRSSNGLESFNVGLWLLRKLGIFYIPEEGTELKGGITVTKFEPATKLIYIRIILDDTDLGQPAINAGILHNFHKKTPANKWPTKFEQLMTSFEYNENKIFANLPEIDYDDAYVHYQGRLFTINLYDIKTSEDVSDLVIKPCVQMYRSPNLDIDKPMNPLESSS